MGDMEKHDEISSMPLPPDAGGIESTRADEARRKLVTRLAAGAFALPAVLAVLSQTPAQASP